MQNPQARMDSRTQRSRDRMLEVASRLFYQHGVRAIGMEQIVEESGIAKTTIYRHFPTKDALVGAYLEREDAEFWAQWDAVVAGSGTAPDTLEALCAWIGERVRRERYRGCPQLNVAAEFADQDHPAKLVSRRHKREMLARLISLCDAAGVQDPDMTGTQIALLFDGAFQSDGRLQTIDAAQLLRRAVRRLCA
jgi:AcrR family transcriptional regulator